MQRFAVTAAGRSPRPRRRLCDRRYRRTARPPAPKASAMPTTTGLEVATFAGGCFWSMEYEFDKLAGVTQTVSGLHGRQDAEPDV